MEFKVRPRLNAQQWPLSSPLNPGEGGASSRRDSTGSQDAYHHMEQHYDSRVPFIGGEHDQQQQMMLLMPAVDSTAAVVDEHHDEQGSIPLVSAEEKKENEMVDDQWQEVL
jgi:hypothetical protein